MRMSYTFLDLVWRTQILPDHTISSLIFPESCQHDRIFPDCTSSVLNKGPTQLHTMSEKYLIFWHITVFNDVFQLARKERPEMLNPSRQKEIEENGGKKQESM